MAASFIILTEKGESVMEKEEQVRGIVQSTLQKLAKLGIDYRELEDVLVTELFVFHDTVLTGNPQDFPTNILFYYLGIGSI